MPKLSVELLNIQIIVVPLVAGSIAEVGEKVKAGPVIVVPDALIVEVAGAAEIKPLGFVAK